MTLSTSINTTGTGLNLAVTGGTFANFLNGGHRRKHLGRNRARRNQTYNYTTPNTTLVLTPNIAVASVAASGSTAETEGVAFSSYLADAANFMANQSAIWTSLGADNNGVVNGTQSGGLYTNGILVNIRPGIVVKNSGGDITVEGDADQSERYRSLRLGLYGQHAQHGRPANAQWPLWAIRRADRSLASRRRQS